MKKVIIAVIFCVLCVVAITHYINSSTTNPDLTSAQSGCDRSFFTVSSPGGYTFGSNCIANNTQLYSTDSRYLVFQPKPLFVNQAYIQSPNSEIKDSTTLSWSISLSRPATIYIMTRHIPGINQTPAWITSGGYIRQTNDDLSNINQYFLRKNEQGLIGLYDIYKRDNVQNAEKFYGASDSTAAAYSMYFVSIVPFGSVTPAPTTNNTPPASVPGGTVGKLKHVFLIALEDANWADVKGNAAASYINGTLLPNFAHAEGDTGGFHTSLGNYFMFNSGDSYGLRTTESPTSYRIGDSNNLANAMIAKGITWKSYQEGLPAGQCYTSTSSSYAVDHNPYAYYNDMTGNPPNATAAKCVAHVRPYTELSSDIQSNTVPQYSFIIPSPCNQGETGCANGIGSADRWLQNEVPKIMNSAAYRDGGVIFITWMEASVANNTTPVGLIVVSANAKKGYSNSIPYRHYSVLHSIQDIFAITPLIRHAGTDASVSDLFTSYP